MTKTTRELLSKLEAELEKLPEDEQEAWAAFHLEELQRQKAADEKPHRERYSFFRVLREAKRPGPKDASMTYEQELYGPHSGSNE